MIKYFSVDLNATLIAKLAGLSRWIINTYLAAIRLRIIVCCHHELSPFVEHIEVDESCFGARQVKGKQARDARGKTIVFGLFKRQGKVYTEIVPDCSVPTLQSIILGKIALFILMVGEAIMILLIHGSRLPCFDNQYKLSIAVEIFIVYI